MGLWLDFCDLKSLVSSSRDFESQKLQLLAAMGFPRSFKIFLFRNPLKFGELSLFSKPHVWRHRLETKPSVLLQITLLVCDLVCNRIYWTENRSDHSSLSRSHGLKVITAPHQKGESNISITLIECFVYLN